MLTRTFKIFFSNFLFRVLEEKRKTLNRDGDLVWFLLDGPLTFSHIAERVKVRFATASVSSHHG